MFCYRKLMEFSEHIVYHHLNLIRNFYYRLDDLCMPSMYACVCMCVCIYAYMLCVGISVSVFELVLDD